MDSKQTKQWAIRAGVAFGIIFAWHLILIASFKHQLRQGEGLASEWGYDVPAGMLDEVIFINPVTNTLTIKYPVERENEWSAMAMAGVQMAITMAAEPQLQKRARKSLDVYAMIIPYSIELEPIYIEGTGVQQPMFGAKTRSAEREVKSVLRNLAAAEEAYFAWELTYTEDISRLGRDSPFDPRDISIAISASDKGWLAIGQQSNVECLLWYGDQFGQHNSTLIAEFRAQEGVPTCRAQSRRSASIRGQ